MFPYLYSLTFCLVAVITPAIAQAECNLSGSFIKAAADLRRAERIHLVTLRDFQEQTGYINRAGSTEQDIENQIAFTCEKDSDATIQAGRRSEDIHVESLLTERARMLGLSLPRLDDEEHNDAMVRKYAGLLDDAFASGFPRECSTQVGK
jgi:hypothetical protein